MAYQTSMKQLTAIVDIISDSTRTLDQCCAAFRSAFPDASQFDLCTVLYTLVQDNLLSIEQRIPALYILYDSHNGDILANPFLPLFLELLSGEQTQTYEKNFIIGILGDDSNKVSEKTISSLIDDKDDTKASSMPDTAHMFNEHRRRIPEHPNPFLNHSLRNMIHVPGSDCTIENRLNGIEFGVYDRFEPAFVRPPLVRFESTIPEGKWIVPGGFVPEVLWDYTDTISWSKNQRIQEMVKTSFNSPLKPNDKKEVLRAITQQDDLVFECGFKPAKLPSLVESNPDIAVEVLLKLFKSPQIADCFTQLINMEHTLHSMEVVNKLTTTVDLPREFLHLYISGCVASCQNVNDRFMQHRLVRLVCIFLQSLIRNGSIDVKDLFAELEAFCVGHSKIREAAALFRLLKQFEM